MRLIQGSACQTVLIVAFAAVVAFGNKTATSQEHPLVFHSRSDLVVIDVVATDAQGKFVPELESKDFRIFENGEEQRLSSFSRFASSSEKFLSTKASPRFEYSNIQQIPGGPVSILLLDMLNSDLRDRVHAKEQMIRFIRALPAGQPMAVAVLGPQIRLIQSFTADVEQLEKSVRSLEIDPLQLDVTETDLQQAKVTGEVLDDRGIGSGQRIANGIQTEGQQFGNYKICKTLDAMTELAQSAVGYAGRKNLLWLAGSFPLPLRGEQMPASFCQTRVENTVNQMATAQVAVYPIDLHGIEVRGLSVGTQSSVSGPELQSDIAASTRRQEGNEWYGRVNMRNVAEQTGGTAFYGTNDIPGAMLDASRNGSQYYVLTYVPKPTADQSLFRRIEIKTNRKDIGLSYRRGYYATSNRPLSAEDAIAALGRVMRPTMPASTMLQLQAKVLAPANRDGAVVVDYIISPAETSFSDGPDGGKRAAFDLMTIAWASDYKRGVRFTDSTELKLSPDEYSRMIDGGIPVHQEFLLKPGAYTLRIGVIGRNNQKIGTLDVPLTIPESGTKK